RFGEWEMDRPLSQLKAPKLIFQRREERARCGKQRIVFLEAGEIQHRLSVQLVSWHAIPDALYCLRYGPPNCCAHLFELRPHRLGLRCNVLVNRLGNASFHIPFYVSARRFSSREYQPIEAISREWS